MTLYYKTKSYFHMLVLLLMLVELYNMKLLSLSLSLSVQLLIPSVNEKKKQQKTQQNPIFMAEPMRASNSFVGTEEYIAPV